MKEPTNEDRGGATRRVFKNVGDDVLVGGGGDGRSEEGGEVDAKLLRERIVEFVAKRSRLVRRDLATHRYYCCGQEGEEEGRGEEGMDCVVCVSCPCVAD